MIFFARISQEVIAKVNSMPASEKPIDVGWIMKSLGYIMFTQIRATNEDIIVEELKWAYHNNEHKDSQVCMILREFSDITQRYSPLHSYLTLLPIYLMRLSANLQDELPEHFKSAVQCREVSLKPEDFFKSDSSETNALNLVCVDKIDRKIGKPHDTDLIANQSMRSAFCS